MPAQYRRRFGIPAADWAAIILQKRVITGVPELIPLAAPANRQGRIAAAVIAGRDSRFRGMQGAAVCGFFGIVHLAK